MNNNFVITEFVSQLIAHDKKGQRVVYPARYAAALIITKVGKIRFSYDGGEVFADADHTVFLPEGLCYTNECLADAESIVINFHTLNVYHKPTQCAAVSYIAAMDHFARIRAMSLEQTPQSHYKIFESIYSLAGEIFRDEHPEPNQMHPLAERAIFLMRANCEDPTLTIAKIAELCHISEVYLRKLFYRELKISPYKKLTEIRMQRAQLLAKEKRPVREIAASVGYSDVFQFSRAYKRFFGCSPSKDRQAK